MHKYDKKMKKIYPEDLYPMDIAAEIFPLKVHLAYAFDKLPNIFGKIYNSSARLWLHRDLARIVLLASLRCYKNHDLIYVLYDGLRTIDAQAAMALSPIVQANPQWLEPPRLLSPPGAGAHPRAMAIDIGLLDQKGNLVDMGTDFDFLAQNSSAATNPAHREYEGLTDQQISHRDILDNSMIKAAQDLELSLYLLPQEWWDFRMPEDVYSHFAPLADMDLPPEMRMVNENAEIQNVEEYRARFETLKIQLQAFI